MSRPSGDGGTICTYIWFRCAVADPDAPTRRKKADPEKIEHAPPKIRHKGARSAQLAAGKSSISIASKLTRITHRTIKAQVGMSLVFVPKTNTDLARADFDCQGMPAGCTLAKAMAWIKTPKGKKWAKGAPAILTELAIDLAAIG